MLHARWNMLLCVFAILASSLAASAQLVIYVDASATGIGDGKTWVDAYVDLQDALADAASDGACMQSSPCEVWVAAGVYKPDRGTGDRNASFFLRNQVALYGGFAGFETTRAQRDWITHESILHGDLLGNDGTAPPPTSNCCYEHDGPGCDDATCEELMCALNFWCCGDFGIEGHWDESCVHAAATTSNCAHICSPDRMDNSRTIVFAEAVDATARIDGFTITAGFAAGFAPDEPRPPIPSWHFYTGGGMYIMEAAPIVMNCLFRENTAVSDPAISVRGDAIAVEIKDCTFERNESSLGATVGGHRDNVGGSPTLAVTGCTFSENNSGRTAVHGDFGCDLTVTDCVFNGQGFGAAVVGAARLTVRRSLFLESEGKAVIGRGTSLRVTDCAFVGNRGSMVVSTDTPSSVLERCLFLNNRNSDDVWTEGFVVHVGALSSASVHNCLFSGNVGYTSVSAVLAGVSLTHCTIVGNQVGRPGGTAGVFANSATARISYCIMHDNRDSEGNVNEVTNLRAPREADRIIINQSNIESWSGSFGGIGNFDADPGFVAPGHWDDAGTPDDFSDDQWIGGDYHLTSGSPGIDVSNSPYVGAHFSDTDLDGIPRMICDAWDQGVYEFGLGDANCDRSIDLTDMAFWTALVCQTGPGGGIPHEYCVRFDFDLDLDIDLSDFAAFQRVFSP